MKPYIILIALVALAFANSLQNQFVWDDHMFIEENPNINIPLKEIPSIFITPIWQFAGKHEAYQTYYRPILSTLHVLNYKVWGPNPLGFHLTNILLHLISTMVLYRVVLLLFNNNTLLSLMAASIFAVHPVNNEPLARVGGGDAIFGFFIILCIYFFLKGKKYLSYLTFFLALLSKEAAVMLPFALVIISTHKKGFKQGVIAIIPYTALIGIYLILRAMIVDTILGGRIPQPIFTRVFTMIVAALDYMRLLVIPYPLSPFYPAKWHTSIFEPKVLIAIIVLILVSFLIFKIRKDKTILFLLLSPFIMLAPVIWRVNTFPAGGELVYIAERFLYVPAMLFSVFISAFFAKLFKDTSQKYLLIGWAMVIIIFTVITIFSNMIWKNDITFFEKVAKESPDASFVHNYLALAYYHSGRYDKAIEEFQMELRLRPVNTEARNSLGGIYYEQGRYYEALKEWQLTVKIAPLHSMAHYNLALALEKVGRKDEATKEYLIALKLNPELQK